MPYTGAGSLRERIKFSRPFAFDDQYGNTSQGWEDMFVVQGNISPLVGGETVQASRLAGRTPVVITVRQSPDTRQIATNWKAANVSNGVEFNLRSVIDPHEGDEQHGKLISMLAEAGVAI